MGSQRVDETSVRAFWRFDRTKSTVMRGMDVSNSEACAFTGETAWAEGRNPAFVGELSEGIRLIHELAQLAGAEELLNRRHKWLRIHQLSRGEGIGFTNRHPLLDDSLQAIQANANLVLKELSNRTNATITQVIDVIKACATDIKLEIDEVVESRQDILVGEGANRVGNCEPKLFIDLVTTHTTKVVTLGVKEAGLQQLLATAHRGGFAWTQLFIELKERLILRTNSLVVRGLDRLFVVLGVPELVDNIVVG